MLIMGRGGGREPEPDIDILCIVGQGEKRVEKCGEGKKKKD